MIIAKKLLSPWRSDKPQANCSVEDLSSFITCLAIPQSVKETKRLGVNNVQDIYYDLIAQFSKWKMMLLINEPIFHTLFSIYLNDGHFNEFMKTEQIYTKNSSIYMKQVRVLKWMLS